MPNTTKGLPYPSNSDPVDIPGDLQSLAEAIDTELNDYLTPATASATYAPLSVSINAQSASYTLVLADAAKQVEMNVASGNTLTIPTNATVAFPVGTVIIIVQTGAGQTTIAGSGGVTVNATPGLKLRAQWSIATITKRAENTWLAAGDLVA